MILTYFDSWEQSTKHAIVSKKWAVTVNTPIETTFYVLQPTCSIVLPCLATCAASSTVLWISPVVLSLSTPVSVPVSCTCIVWESTLVLECRVLYSTLLLPSLHTLCTQLVSQTDLYSTPALISRPALLRLLGPFTYLSVPFSGAREEIYTYVPLALWSDSSRFITSIRGYSLFILLLTDMPIP